MASPLARWIFLFLQISLLLGLLEAGARSVIGDGGDGVGIQMIPRRQPRDDGGFSTHAEKEGGPMGMDDPKTMKHHMHDHDSNTDDPSVHIFFNLEDLMVGKRMLLYFPHKTDPSRTPRLLPREEAESIPFTSTKLSSILSFFSFPDDSRQARAMANTLHQCELEPIKGELKFCATSMEEMLDRTHQIFATESRALATTYISMKKTAKALQNYTVLETPKQIEARRMIGCHTMPYPYAVYYCHIQLQSETRLFQVALGGAEVDRIDALAACHMDTSRWDRDHVSFKVLHIEPGSAPVCHFFPVDNLVWVPRQ
ncbi:hypothetical protein SAY86_009511 [Trapa natans]|uniref:BURP domain-containing protein n=1 Tax=Trapa natans TaxID=22666 RepID=A0AAN7L4L1_TRANT|nr:hypothetical protein SAY86_009511 [Trapa natans]